MTKVQMQLAAAREKAANEAIDAYARGQIRTGFDQVNPGMPPALRLGPSRRIVPARRVCGTPGCPGEHRDRYEVCSE